MPANFDMSFIEPLRGFKPPLPGSRDLSMFQPAIIPDPIIMSLSLARRWPGSEPTSGIGQRHLFIPRTAERLGAEPPRLDTRQTVHGLPSITRSGYLEPNLHASVC
jgi:hypothetical protein